LTTEDAVEVDDLGRRAVLDLMTDESAEGMDLIPGSEIGELTDDAQAHRRRLNDMAKQAEALQGDQDNKLIKLVNIVKQLIADGYYPIVFCRFIPTVEYLTDALRDKLRGVEVAAVTGLQPPDERERRIAELVESGKRVLVCTDCLSEGINLQAGFNAVVHYDLSWNPTRHEQREGRVDRYGQPSPRVRTVTYYGIDNQIDGIVLDVLLRKHKEIVKTLGVSVPVPSTSDDLIEAIFEGLLLREDSGTNANQLLPGFDDYLKGEQRAKLDLQWKAVADRESRSRTMFAQQSIDVTEVEAELKAVRESIGYGVDVARFVNSAVRMHGGNYSVNGAYSYNLSEAPRGLRDLLPPQVGHKFTARFELPVKPGQLYLTRTHPVVEALASYVMNTALDSSLVEDGTTHAKRAGAIRTRAVQRRTTLMIIRLRYHLITRIGEDERQLLAEDSLTVAFEGTPESSIWLEPDQMEPLLHAQPDENIVPAQAAIFIQKVVDGFDAHLLPKLNEIARQRGEELLDAHRRVRDAAYRRGDRRIQHRVEPQLPPDILGIYVLLPAMAKS
jgi:hypothetical protein